MQKSTILETLKSLPNDFNLDELIERLLVLDKIEHGLFEAEKGDLMNHSEVKKLISEWKK
jgi:predicted transcriptional regulator